ncbi:MAG: hypothetical protein HZC40_16780 [Chloroflexi bacterium]|nr:hypothetical protein [Chloroflexota bacterium]
MTTFEAYVSLGSVSIAVSAVGAPIRVESKHAAVDAPAAILTVLLPFPSEPWAETAALAREMNFDPGARDDENQVEV